MLYREIIAVCSQIHTEPINTLCGQNVEMLNVKPGGTYSHHLALILKIRFNFHSCVWCNLPYGPFPAIFPIEMLYLFLINAFSHILPLLAQIPHSH